MTTSQDDLFIYRSYLYPLSDLKDFEIADENPDVRGWHILGNDGNKFGSVHELIVDTKAMKVRYLDVDIKKDIFKDTKETLHVLIPIGVAILNKEDKNVIVPDLNLEKLSGYPIYRREPVHVLRDYERSVRDFYAGDRHTERGYDPDFYEDEYYSDRNFY